MNQLGKDIMAAIDRKISGPPREAGAATIAAVVGKQTICSAEDRKKILELDRQYAAAYETVLASDYAGAKRAFATEQARQVDLLASGQFDNADFWGLPDIVSDFQMRQQSAKMQMRQISVAAATISKPICTKVSSLLTEAANQVETEARAQHEHYAIQFPGSPLADRLRALAAQVLQRVASGGGSRPSHYAPFVL